MVKSNFSSNSESTTTPFNVFNFDLLNHMCGDFHLLIYKMNCPKAETGNVIYCINTTPASKLSITCII